LGCIGRRRPCLERQDPDMLETAEERCRRPSSNSSNNPRHHHFHSSNRRIRWDGVRIPFPHCCQTTRHRRELRNTEVRDRHWTQGISNTAKARDGIHLGRRKKKRAAEDRQPREQAITTEGTLISTTFQPLQPQSSLNQPANDRPLFERAGFHGSSPCCCSRSQGQGGPRASDGGAGTEVTWVWKAGLVWNWENVAASLAPLHHLFQDAPPRLPATVAIIQDFRGYHRHSTFRHRHSGHSDDGQHYI
jgi:hypothetical protein